MQTSPISSKNIFLAPRSNETSHENFSSSILGGQAFSFFEPYLNEAERQLLKNNPRIAVWGCAQSLISRWKKMNPGDYVLFYEKGRFVYSAQVTFTKLDTDLGKKLWPLSKTGKPWPCLFFVDHLKEINIPIRVIQELADYEVTWDRVQGFMPLNERGLRSIQLKFGDIPVFLNQTPEVYSALNNLIKANQEEIVEGEIKDYEVVDKVALLRDATAFVNTKDSHVVISTPRKVRVESRSQKQRIAKLEGHSCQICGWVLEWTNAKGKRMFRIDIDHIVDKAEGGTEESSNLWALCPNCHVKKTLGVIRVDIKSKKIFENDIQITLNHDNHLGW